MYLSITGASKNNLRNISLKIPLGEVTLFAGPSGSGKSSLAIQTILHEGRRRSLETMRGSADAMELPPAEAIQIEGLPFTIGFVQDYGKVLGPLHTVGTFTETYPLLQYFFATEGILHCPDEKIPLRYFSSEELLHEVEANYDQKKIAILAPIEADKSGLMELFRLGFSRVFLHNKFHFIEEAFDLIPKKQALSLVVDRILLTEGKSQRLLEAIKQAFAAGNGRLRIMDVVSNVMTDYASAPWSHHRQTFLPKPSVERVNFRSIHGACVTCRGTGKFQQKRCHACLGHRLSEIGRHIQWDNHRIGDLCLPPLQETLAFFINRQDRLSKSISKRLNILCSLGLGHLPLHRNVDNLSSGERSLLRLSRLFFYELSQALYVLDEPSHGLDMSALDKLKDHLRAIHQRGNTILIVDHHPAFHKFADNIFHFGPGAGSKGGEIVQQPNTVTAFSPPTPHHNPQYISLDKLSFQSIQKQTFQFQMNGLNIITGPTGSGKTTLLAIFESLLNGKNTLGFQHERFSELPKNLVVRTINAKKIQANNRSCVATLAQVWTPIRNLYGQTRGAKINGLTSSHFSFNRSGGRCENCHGLGTIMMTCPPLPAQEKTCSLCAGQRFDSKTLSVYFRGHHINDILQFQVDEALRIFQHQPNIATHLQSLVEVGLNYLTLGQPSNSLSSGEMRRIQLARQLNIRDKLQSARTVLLIDDPSAALHQQDLYRIYNTLMLLRDQGCTLICVSNAQRLIANADHLIQLKEPLIFGEENL